MTIQKQRQLHLKQTIEVLEQEKTANDQKYQQAESALAQANDYLLSHDKFHVLGKMLPLWQSQFNQRQQLIKEEQSQQSNIDDKNSLLDQQSTQLQQLKEACSPTSNQCYFTLNSIHSCHPICRQ